MASNKPTAIDAEIGERIRQSRLRQKMGQETLGEAIGVTFQQIQKYERGRNRIAVSRLIEIAAALNEPILNLIEGVQPVQVEIGEALPRRGPRRRPVAEKRTGTHG